MQGNSYAKVTFLIRDFHRLHTIVASQRTEFEFFRVISEMLLKLTFAIILISNITIVSRSIITIVSRHNIDLYSIFSIL